MNRRSSDSFFWPKRWTKRDSRNAPAPASVVPGENDPGFRSVRSLATLPASDPAEFVRMALEDEHFKRRTILVACDLRRDEIEALKLKMNVVILGPTVSLLRPGKPEIKVRATGRTSRASLPAVQTLPSLGAAGRLWTRRRIGSTMRLWTDPKG
jgi:hypothetical protein